MAVKISPKSIPELPIVDWVWYIMFETLEQLTKPLHSYYQNPKKQRWVFILHSICILAFLVDYALLLLRHGSLYHHVAVSLGERGDGIASWDLVSGLPGDRINKQSARRSARKRIRALDS